VNRQHILISKLKIIGTTLPKFTHLIWIEIWTFSICLWWIFSK